MSADALPTVLVVDDDAAVRYTLRSILEEESVRVVEAADGQAGLTQAQNGDVDLVITDLQMPGLSGLGLLDALSDRPGAPRVVMVTAHGSERVAVEAMQRGALDYFAKPFDPDDIVRVVRRALESVRLARENERLRGQLALARTMVFASDEMRRLARLVERAAPRDVTVLITGESGTGKELVARAIYGASPRSNKPFVTFNCAALPRDLAEAELFGHSKGAFTGADKARRGLFREADGGTILLDELGEMHPQTQASLLRVLQEREVRPVGEDRPVAVDVRVLATTNRSLKDEIARGAFRADLYYRLAVVELHVPPLRERRDDIVPLAAEFVRRYGDRFGLANARLSQRVVDRLRAGDWPGNVRQLEHIIESMVALAGDSLIDDEPFEDGDRTDPNAMSLKDRVNRFERDLLAKELEANDGNQTHTARALGISRVTLIDKMKKHGLK